MLKVGQVYGHICGVVSSGRMFRPRWGEDGDPGGGSPGQGGGPPGPGRARTYAGAASQGVETQQERNQRFANSRKEFQSRLEMEGNRKSLGKGNIVTVMKDKIDDSDPVLIQMREIGKLLTHCQIPKEHVLGLKQNEFRRGQVEIFLKEEVNVDLVKMEEVIEKEQMNMTVGKFDHVEEVIMLYGLPFSTDFGGMKDRIKEAVGPFVEEIISVEPSRYYDKKTIDYFQGTLNGNWRLVVKPKRGVGVPNYIVVDRVLSVPVHAVYKKWHFIRPQMCSNCYREGHFRRSPECQGVRKWSEYCEEFEENWRAAREANGNTTDVSPSGTRLDVLHHQVRNEQKKVKDLEKKCNKLQDEVSEKVKKAVEEARREFVETEKDLQAQVKNLLQEKENFLAVNEELQREMVEAAEVSTEGVETLVSETDKIVDSNDAFINQVGTMTEDISSAVKDLEKHLIDLSPTENSGEFFDDNLDDFLQGEQSEEDMVSGKNVEKEKSTSEEINGEDNSEEGVQQKNVVEEKNTLEDLENIGEDNNCFNNGSKDGVAMDVEKVDQKGEKIEVTERIDVSGPKRKSGDSPVDHENKMKKTGKYPALGTTVMAWKEGEEKVKLIVKSKKDQHPNGGGFNCYDSDGKKTYMNFNRIFWEEVSDNSSGGDIPRGSSFSGDFPRRSSGPSGGSLIRSSSLTRDSVLVSTGRVSSQTGDTTGKQLYKSNDDLLFTSPPPPKHSPKLAGLHVTVDM